MTRYHVLLGCKKNGDVFFGFGTNSSPMVCTFLPGQGCDFGYFSAAMNKVMVGGMANDYLVKMAYAVFCALHLGTACNLGDSCFDFTAEKIADIKDRAELIVLSQPTCFGS